MKSTTTLLLVALTLQPVTQALAAGPSRPIDSPTLERQILSQGPMLAGNLRQARAEGLRHDPEGMAYSLQEARRVLNAMKEAARLEQGKAGASSRDTSLPLGQTLELDRSESGGREQAVGRFELDTGTIPLEAVESDIGHALQALNHQPPALDRALHATEAALKKMQP